MRLFFALWPAPPVRKALSAAAAPLLEACEGRPVAARNYHLTLAFLGKVEASRLDPLRAAAGSVHATAFELALDTFGHWPRAGVAWLGSSRPTPAATALAAALWAALEPLGFPPETRPFVPHLTLLRRCRHCELPAVPQPVRWPVREFVLVRSETRPEGADYEILDRWELA
ncbi:RNA 2',3'-cyclic phosphodiesterase [Wenzhouxiangella sp. XN24]|uniref:RNA 2',3'-cyclic phosphodiesterase n=1 Tax=Wenzhouxiangella sp. XN24 TaxID=2713569 RepID=UPI0013ECDC73|nr:RNA 2',3'-cyclic phosphodiesterase [Wenzhouxiangella sp. XN24]NGX15258.1 RNA 2',3'-cyclic phosphodiesterase [Wenzhouxiangella sp. XN24]